MPPLASSVLENSDDMSIVETDSVDKRVSLDVLRTLLSLLESIEYPFSCELETGELVKNDSWESVVVPEAELLKILEPIEALSTLLDNAEVTAIDWSVVDAEEADELETSAVDVMAESREESLIRLLEATEAWLGARLDATLDEKRALKLDAVDNELEVELEMTFEETPVDETTLDEVINKLLDTAGSCVSTRLEASVAVVLVEKILGTVDS